METRLNPKNNSAPTGINRFEGSALQPAEFMAGTVIGGSYRIVQKLNVISGEADLYLCRHLRSGTESVAKIYRRKDAIKTKVLNSLRRLRSRYIAPLLDSGEFQGHTFTIMPYYKNGSLKGRKFSYEKLRSAVIPCIAEGLRYLHENRIFHRDLKPSNLMLSDDSEHILITDFGISSVAADGQSMLVTTTGLSPEYSAPETFSNVFLKESDYYSLGITQFELYTGHTPFSSRDLSEQELASMASINSIPFPENFPPDLAGLIKGLTYRDLTYRGCTENPNRRWTWEEVKKWCTNTPQLIPGEPARIRSGADSCLTGRPAGGTEGKSPDLPEQRRFSYPLVIINSAHEKMTASDMKSAVHMLASNREECGRFIQRKLLSEFFRENGCLAAASAVTDFENEISDDLKYAGLLTTLQQFYDGRDFFWNNRIFPENLDGLSSFLIKKYFPESESIFDNSSNFSRGNITIKGEEKNEQNERNNVLNLYHAVITHLSVLKKRKEASVLAEYLAQAQSSSYDLKTLVIAMASFADPQMPVIMKTGRYKGIEDFSRNLECIRRNLDLYALYINENCEYLFRYTRCINREISSFMTRLYSQWHEFHLNKMHNSLKAPYIGSIRPAYRNPVLHSPDDINQEIIDGIIGNKFDSLTIDYEFTRSQNWELESPEDYDSYRNIYNPFYRADRINPIVYIKFPVILTQAVTSLASAFLGFERLRSVIIEDTSMIRSMSEMFSYAREFNGEVGAWNTSNVTQMDGMFSNALLFNRSLNKWDTSKVETMKSMFWCSRSFNRDLNEWNTESVKDMSAMFSGASRFNSPVDKWNTSKVNDMSWMFNDAVEFNQPVENWNTSSVRNMNGMFKNARSFNQPLDRWDVSGVNSMKEMFAGASSFRYSVSSWKNM